MNFLYLFVIVPLLTMAGVALQKDAKHIKITMAIVTSIQLILSFVLLGLFLEARAAGDNSEMLFCSSLDWYRTLHIQLSVGVDGISVLMLMLSSIIVFTGTFTSWSMTDKVKEYFLWFLM